jgi:uncharacterized protein (TIGR02246 family)
MEPPTVRAPSAPAVTDAGTDPTTDHAARRRADLAAIHQVIADVERGFNTNDAELAVRRFARDASAVAVTGVRTVGLDALLEAHRVGFAGPLRDQFARYEVGDVAFVAPDVALVHKRARAVDADGVSLDVGHAMVALYVLVRRGDRWWIAARQNTLVAPAP